MRVSIIVAASTNNVIGANGGLPWRLPEDLRRFKEITMGRPILMGRATWDSIGRPLPGRQNIVLTRRADLELPGCDVVSSFEKALQLAEGSEELMVIGGGKVYEQCLADTDRIYLTRVHAMVAGDTHFPPLVGAEWREVSRENYPAGPEREHAFDILTLDRIGRELR